MSVAAEPDDPWANVPAPDNVVPFGPPAWMDDVPPYGEPMTAVSRAPLPIEYFDDIQMQLTGLWLIKRLLPAIGLAVLYGHPGCGKTFLALDWALHVALGWEWQGRKVKQGAVIYVAAEGLSGLRNRVEAFKRHHGVKGVPFALIPTPIDMQAPDADVNRLIEAIRAVMAALDMPVSLIVIDTISKTFGAGKENTDDMVSYVANCGRVAAEFECLTMPVHHRPKDSESEEPRGHSSLKGGADAVILVEAGETKKVRVTKLKDGEDGVEMLFRLKSIELGRDEDGEPVTSCVVEPTDVDLTPRGDTQEAKAQRLPDGAKHLLNLLDETVIQSGFRPPSEIPDAAIDRNRVGKVANLDDWRTMHSDMAGHGPDTKPDTVSKAFRRNLEKLQASDIVRVWQGYAWRTWAPRTRSDMKPDMPGHQDMSSAGHARTSGVPPKGGNPPMSGLMSDPAAPAENEDPDAWRSNPILNGDDR